MKYLFFLLLFCSTLYCEGADKKDWVKNRPIDKLTYIGIGFCSKSDPLYLQKAKQHALSDLVSEIKVEIQTHSLLQTLEKDSEFSSYLSQNIQISTQEALEQFELTDTWENNNEYWVYYRLSKLDYEDIMARRKAKAARDGYTFWVKGNEALNNGNLFSSIDMYTKGLDAIQPCANEELKYEHLGNNINVAVELYNSINQIFNNISISANPKIIQKTSFKVSNDVISFLVTKNNIPLKNIKLKVSFVKGSGLLSGNHITNNSGIAETSIQNITSNASIQEVVATIDPMQFSIYTENPYCKNTLNIFRKASPHSFVTIEIEKTMNKAYISYSGRNNETLSKSIRSLLTNNYFDIVETKDEANILIIIKSSIKRGEKVKGEMYDFIEYFTNADIKIVNTANSQVLLNYTVSNDRSLSPISATEQTAENSAIREVQKRINKELKKELDKLTITQ